MKTHAEPRTLLALLRLVAIVTMVGLGMPAMAALGGDLSSVEADRAQMKAEINVTQASSYSVHEMKSEIGTKVREYVSSNGRVFAVAWHGPYIPDMKQLLGTYFRQYVSAAQAAKGNRPGRRPLNIQQPGLVVQSSGYMHAYSGRAYDPGLLPSGVTADAIQ